MYAYEHRSGYKGVSQCTAKTLKEKALCGSSLFILGGKSNNMGAITEKGIYYAKNDFYKLIKSVGGQWNDAKFRPLVALVQSTDHPEIFWAIPMGDYEHRDEKGKKRIKSYMSRSDKDIASCFYHVGKTDKKSIFFISDVVPITLNYIEREYFVGPKTNQQQYIIKNKSLIRELERKIGRIISFEKKYTETQGKPKFRQRILDIHSCLLEEVTQSQVAPGKTE